MEFVDREILELTGNGEWLSDGEPITHEPTRELFYRSLKRHPDGSWWLEIGRETKRIEVQDTAFFVKRIEGNAESGFEIIISNGRRETLELSTLSLEPGRLTCITSGGQEAKFLRAPHSELLFHATDSGNGTYRLRSGGSEREIREFSGPILFFDGVCGLCNRFVDFLMNRDLTGRLRFAPLQGRTARARLPAVHLNQLDTVVCWQQGQITLRSDAALGALAALGGAWRALLLFRILPRFLRDSIYDGVAKNRYQWFGRREVCRMPSAEERGRLLD